MNCRRDEQLCINDQLIEDLESVTYLGAIMDNGGGSEADIKRRLELASQAFAMLGKIWRSANFSTKTKIRVFNSNVMAVLYGDEM